MPSDKIPHTSLPSVKPDEPIPYFVSDRLDVLREELDDEQVLRLHHELHKLDFGQWINWFSQNLGKIGEFDTLTHTQRKKALLGKSAETALLLHHSCVVVECLRVRINHHYMQLHDDKDLPPMKDVDYRFLIALAIGAFENFWAYDTWHYYHVAGHPFFVDVDKT